MAKWYGNACGCGAPVRWCRCALAASTSCEALQPARSFGVKRRMATASRSSSTGVSLLYLYSTHRIEVNMMWSEPINCLRFTVKRVLFWVNSSDGRIERIALDSEIRSAFSENQFESLIDATDCIVLPGSIQLFYVILIKWLIQLWTLLSYGNIVHASVQDSSTHTRIPCGLEIAFMNLLWRCSSH